MTVEDKVVLITGASEGIGKATAELLHSKGANLALASRSKDKLEAVAASLPGSFVIPVDMTDGDSIVNMVKGVQDHYGRIDVLINNAGQALLGRVTEIKLDDFKKVMDLNVYGPLLALQAVVPGMTANGGGTIINVSSLVSKIAIPGIGAYTATKYALNGLMLTARADLAESNISVSVMHPGATATGFGQNAILNTDEQFSPPAGMQPDTPEMVAEKILEAIDSDPTELFMSEEVAQQFA